MGTLGHASQKVLGAQQAHALGSAAQRHLRPGNSGVLLGAKLGLSADRTLDELRQRLARRRAKVVASPL
jgi:hypothetical protein